MQDTATELHAFTARYIDLWNRLEGTAPQTESYNDLNSDCILEKLNASVLWSAVQHQEYLKLEGVERALDLIIQPTVHGFYGSQYSADLSAEFDGLPINLLQVWNAADFSRLQENLIGHLVTQRRLNLSPTLFIGTFDSDEEVISCCNLTGQVVIERLGKKDRKLLANNLSEFLQQCVPTVVKL